MLIHSTLYHLLDLYVALLYITCHWVTWNSKMHHHVIRLISTVCLIFSFIEGDNTHGMNVVQHTMVYHEPLYFYSRNKEDYGHGVNSPKISHNFPR